ncbi:MAG TPA: glycosyltransferase family 2 protein [Bacteroidota bacterium]|nr:glycosyltransferase family 2 protein [Bacteroidota bacterium]
MNGLSVIVVTLNEERNIARCLKSVAWADEIVLVDSFSTDTTIEIAKTFTSKIFQYEYPGYSKQVERGIQQAANEWIFILDADEEVSTELALSLRDTIAQPEAADGYYVNRKVQVFGKWIYHSGWYPDWQFRLMRKASLVAEHLEIHGAFTTHGRKGRLEGELFHYTYDTIEQYLEKINDYTSLHVSNKLKDEPDLRVGLGKIVFSPVSHFLRMFVVNKGYKDGIPGFFLSVYSALYTLLLYAKTWEYQFKKAGAAELPPVTNFELQRYKRL